MEELSKEDSVCANACAHMATNMCVCVLANTLFTSNFHIYNYPMDFY